jgi:1,3-beta-glucan synthase
MKQSKLRRRRVIRYAILYFTLLVIFVALIAGPVVAGKYMPPNTISDALKGLPFNLVQPNNLNKDNTNSTMATGTGKVGYTGAGLTKTKTGADASATGKIKLF